MPVHFAGVGQESKTANWKETRINIKEESEEKREKREEGSEKEMEEL